MAETDPYIPNSQQLAREARTIETIASYDGVYPLPQIFIDGEWLNQVQINKAKQTLEKLRQAKWNTGGHNQ